MTTGMPSRDFDLQERFVADRGTYYFSGLHTLVRLPLEQHRRDRAAGLRSGIFITGYPGSPLAGYDLQLERRSSLLSAYGIVHVPASSEERAATALMGSQMLDNFPHEHYDGVVGFWYGKGPGVDRSGDAFKHGNFAGTSRHGAVVILSGEDHEASSSTMPFQEDQAFIAAGIPIMAPASVRQIYEFGLHAVALSRASGCWVALKLPTALCDAGATFCVDPSSPSIVLPEIQVEGKPFAKYADFTFFPGTTLAQERYLYVERHTAAIAYARANGLNYRVGTQGHARVGIVTVGKSFGDIQAALSSVGADFEDLSDLGIAVLVYGMPYPFDRVLLSTFACDVDQIVVIEEKRDLLETNVRAALHEAGSTIQVIGKRTAGGAELFPVEGGFDADLILGRIGGILFNGTRLESQVAERLAVIEQCASPAELVLRHRTPNYCSGCPHNTSTLLPEGAIAWGSPGCHSFASIIEQPERHVEAMTQYGGEGLPWIGLAPFTEQRHIFQNVGDGSIFHSSYENIRSCMAAGVSITFKILYNGVVANTGAQVPVGQLPVVELVHLLEIDGVERIALVTKKPAGYRRAGFGPAVRLHTPDGIQAVQAELAGIEGVTVLLYDESCANERRRRQRRGQLPAPTRHVMVNERLCEACGDCGRVSNCMSLMEVDTPLGPKIQIHASSCNEDESCLRGNCPSFVTVETAPGSGYRKSVPPEVPRDLLDEPERPAAGRGYALYLPGLGGTGVITANAILATAAWLDGLNVATYDQTGAAQKWGPVLSSLVVSENEQTPSTAKVGSGEARVYLAFDLVAASTSANLARCRAGLTVAVVNTDAMATGEIVRNRRINLEEEAMVSAVRSTVSADSCLTVPARQIAEALFGDYLMANLVVVGTAYQAGLLPMSSTSIERAIVANGVAVRENLLAWQWGRAWAVDVDAVRALLGFGTPERAGSERPAGAGERGARNATARRDPGTREPLVSLGHTREHRLRQAMDARESLAPLPSELRSMVFDRAGDLVSYQDMHWAERYLNGVARAAAREQERCPGEWRVTRTVGVYLYKVMAYKDEYEVARLYLLPSFDHQVHGKFEAPVRITCHLHPPFLRAIGVRRKIRLGPWFRPVFRVLRVARALRGTRLDPFSKTEVRCQERAAIDWYEEVLDQALDGLHPAVAQIVAEIAALPDAIRGYEELKLASLVAARERAEELLEKMRDERVNCPAEDDVQGFPEALR
jgi:indolepyruvate ferredoxin oxidoreductase